MLILLRLLARNFFGQFVRWVDLAPVAANVASDSSASRETVTAGATVARGDSVYLDSADSKVKLTDSNAATTDEFYGIVLADAAANQPTIVHRSGSINLGATLVVGETYCVSDGAGKICPVADIAAGEYVTHVGIATTAALLNVRPFTSGVAHG